MPSGKHRSKEDTWKEDELKQAIQGTERSHARSDRKREDRPKERSGHRDDDRRERRSERKDKENDDKKRREHREDVANGRPERRRRRDPTEKERDRLREKDHDRERDRDRDRERRKERDGDRERERERRKDGSRERRSDKEGERQRERRERDAAKENRRAREHSGERRRDREKDDQRRRDRDNDGERRRDRDKDGERRRDRDKDDEKRRDWDKDGERRRDRDKDGEKRREKGGDDRRETREKEGQDSRRDDRKRDQEKKEKGHRDGDKEDKRDRHLKPDEDGSRERRHKEKSGDRSRGRDEDSKRRSDDTREKSRERPDRKGRDRERPQGADGRRRRPSKDDEAAPDLDVKSKEGGESQEDKVKRRAKEMLESLKKEEKLKPSTSETKARFRAATLEEADAVDEEEDHRRNKSSVSKTVSVTNAEEVHDEDDADDYEDDFEDYEEDFEDDDETPETDLPQKEDMSELLKAIHAENEDVRTFSREGSKSLSSRSSDDDSREVKYTSTRPSTGRGRINFVAAKQKQISEKVASRTKKRGQELMHLIDLDVASFDIFDLPPLNEYELYIKNFGRSDTRQAYVQCNDDNVDRETQSEEIEMRTKWVQHPPEGFICCGDNEDTNEDEYTRATEKASINSVHLSSFLQRAGQRSMDPQFAGRKSLKVDVRGITSKVCLVLLEEAAAVETSTMFKDKKDMACSDGYIQLVTKQPYLEGRRVEGIHISPVQTHLVLTAYGPVLNKGKIPTKVDETLQNKSVVCLWNINEPSKPQKILMCESVPRCCCLSPSKATLAFAGLDDGSLVAWDLRESSSLHRNTAVGDTNEVLRSPTFSTAGVMSEENHHSPVRSVLPLVMPGDSAKASVVAGAVTQEDMLGLSFQLASLEENAVINIWVVVELEKADIAGSESELGLAPGGKIKIIKSASLALGSPFRDSRKKMSIQTLTMQFLPQDPNHIYIGTDGGYVLHSVRYGARSPPKAYRAEIDCLVDVTTIAVSPWDLPCIVAGCKDGSLRLYNLKNESPLMTWSDSTRGSAVVSARWSRSKPSVLYVLDADSRLHVWDLLQSDAEPVAVEQFKHSRVVAFDLSNDYAATGIGMAGRHAELVLGYENGAVEVHRISSRFATTSADELDRFASYLDGVL